MPVINCFLKDKMSIFWSSSMCIWDCSERCWWILTYQSQFLDIMQREFAVRNISCLNSIWMEYSTSGVFSACPISDGFQQTSFASNECLFGEQLLYEYQIEQQLINVETSFSHANHSASFVSGGILRINILYQNFIIFLLLVYLCFPVTVLTRLNRRLHSVPR